MTSAVSQCDSHVNIAKGKARKITTGVIYITNDSAACVNDYLIADNTPLYFSTGAGTSSSPFS